MHVLIPAGGRGVRLQPLTHFTPKPLLPLGDRPLLTRIVEQVPPEWPVTVLVSPALEEHFRRWTETLPRSRRVTLSVERERAGEPRGPVLAVAECLADLGIREDLVLLMGDSLLPFTLPQFLGPEPPQALRLAACRLPDLREAARFGVVELDDSGRVRSFEEKPARPRSPWVFTGCLYLPSRLLPALREIAASAPPQMGELVAGFLARGERIEAYPVTGEWHDIGTFASYLAAHRSLLSPSQRQALLAQGNRLAGTVYVHPTARVTRSRLEDCLIQAEAVVADADLTTCVVHPSVSVIGRTVTGKLLSASGEQSLCGGISPQRRRERREEGKGNKNRMDRIDRRKAG
jgi:glucose-1-phosphate thymidylyltransferase